MSRISFVVCILTCLAGLASARHRHLEAPQESPVPAPAKLPGSTAPVGSPNSAPGPSVDCSTVMFDMMDCLGYLSYGSNDTKPAKSCCSGFKSMMKVGGQCICEALKTSRDMGIVLNLTKAASLPSECGVSAPPISKCGISLSPASPPSAGSPIPAPATSPSLAPNKEPPVPEPATPPVPEPASPPKIFPGTTPSPSPLAHAGAHGISTPFSLLIAMLLVSFSYLAM